VGRGALRSTEIIELLSLLFHPIGPTKQIPAQRNHFPLLAQISGNRSRL
jgi:hypothetical protein